MISYQDAVDRMHTRGIVFNLKQYLFVMQVALSESPTVAYCMVYDTAEFKKKIGTEDEEEYLSSHSKDAEVMLQQQECQHLKELVEEWRRTEIQNEASNLKTFKYSSEDVANMLSNLLYTRSANLEDASVRDIVQLIRELNAQGALDGEGNGFSRHFISVLPHMSVLCPICQRESDIAVGMTCYCSRCGAEFKWSEEEQRYYPQPQKL
jgi:hypothetical protein